MPLVLLPLGAEQAREVLAARGLPYPAAPGWPDAHTLIAFALAVEGGREPGWLVLEDGVVVGQCAVTGDPVGGVVEISYGLAASVRGAGRGTALVRQFTEELLARPDVTEVVARVEVGNVASQRALLAAGFALSHSPGHPPAPPPGHPPAHPPGHPPGDELTFVRGR